MKSPRMLVRGLAAAALIAAGTAGAQAQEVTLKFHHIWPAQAMAPVRVIQPWCDKITAESRGRLKCQMLHAMSGGGTPAQLVDRIKDGVDDLTITLPGYTAGRFPAMEVFELPFMTNSAESGAAAAWDYLQKHALKEFPGTKILATWVHDEGYVHTSARQVKSLDDFKGLKMRAPTRQTNKLLAKLGATPVGMPVTGVADALSKGTIDGFALPWEVIPAFKLHEMTKFHTETDPSRPALYSAGFIFAMNQAKYDSLPADVKKVVDELSGEVAARMFGRGWDKVDRRGMAFMQAAGVQFTAADATFVKAVTDKTAPVVDAWVKAAEAKGLKDPRKVLGEFRAEIKKLQ